MSTPDVLAELLIRNLQGVISDRLRPEEDMNIEFEARIFTSKERLEDETRFVVKELHWNNLHQALKAQGLREVHSTIRNIGFFLKPDRFRIIEEEGVLSFHSEQKYPFFSYDDELSWSRYSISGEKTISSVQLGKNVPRYVLLRGIQEPGKNLEEEGEEFLKIVEGNVSKWERSLHSSRHERFLKRTSYYPVSDRFRSLARIDMSEVFDGSGQSHYEVEIEMLNVASNYLRAKEFILFCQKIVALFRGTDTFYNRFVHQTLCTMINANATLKSTISSTQVTNKISNAYVDKRIFNQVRTLKKDDLVSGGIVNGKVEYGALLKTDGFGFTLVFSSLGIWLIAPPYTYNLISPTALFRNEDLTVLQGELIPKERRRRAIDREFKYVYQLFDVLYLRGVDVRTVYLPDRLEAARDYLDTIRLENVLDKLLRIYMKGATLISGPGDFFAINKRLLLEVDNPNSDFVYEGIIWNPWNTAYFIDIDVDLENSARSLANKAEIVKWKDASLTTIDFRYSIVNGEKMLMATEWEETSPGENVPKDVPFRGDARYPFNQATMVDWQSLEDNNVLPGSIGEYTYDRAKKQFVWMRDRSEKAHPNTNETVAIPNWQEINFPITREAITGESFQLMFYYHLRIKTKLMNEGSETLLDLGAGQGGIIWRWGRYKRIVAVEPNPNHRLEFIRRADLAGLTVIPEDGVLPPSDERFIILIAGTAQETERIQAQVKRIAPQGVNCVSLLDVGTFLWQTPEVLNASMATIQNCLAPGGKFVWKMMNGDLVRALPQIQEATASARNVEDSIHYGNFELRYNVEAGELNKKVKVYIPEGITTEGQDDGMQTEWLTSVEEMYKFFPEKDYEYGDRNLCNEEAFMPSDSQLLSQLFEYGVIRKRGSTLKQKEPEKPAEESETRVMRKPGRVAPATRTGIKAQILNRNTPSTAAQAKPAMSVKREPVKRIQARKTEPVKINAGEDVLKLDDI